MTNVHSISVSGDRENVTMNKKLYRFQKKHLQGDAIKQSWRLGLLGSIPLRAV